MKPTSWWIATLFLPAFAAHAQANIDCSSAKIANPANATYTIEGDTVTLTNGARSQPAAPGSYTVHETKLIEGTQACGEFDGQPVAVVLLSDDSGVAVRISTWRPCRRMDTAFPRCCLATASCRRVWSSRTT